VASADDKKDKKDDDTEKSDRKGNIEFWLKWISAAKKKARQHWDDSSEAWKEFEAGAPDTGAEYKSRTYDDERSYPIYWSSAVTLKPAFYSRTPNIYTKRRFDINDPVALTASLITERLGAYLLENSNFDDVMRASVDDFIHAGKATIQVVYDAALEPVKKKLSPQPREDGENDYYNEDGTTYDGEVMKEGDEYFYESDGVVPDSQKIYLVPGCYDEIIHSPDAKSQAEVLEVGYYFSLDIEEAKKKFPKKITDKLTWKTSKTYDRESDETDRTDLPGKFIDGWEIWCKESGKVYWVCEEYKDDFLQVKDDPYKLKGFFPSAPFILQNKPSKSLYPTPAYVHLRPVLKQIHKNYAKVYALLEDALDRKALVDNSNEGLIGLLQQKGNKWIAIDNMASMIEKGGIGNMVQFLPVQEFVQAISELNAVRDVFKNDFYEAFGVPDILRGVSDPLKAEGTNQIEAGAAHDRFIDLKKQVQELARNAMQMMLDLAFQVLDEQKLANITGYAYMDPAHQQRFTEALQLLRNDEAALIRIDIETDSMSNFDQNRKAAKRSATVQTLMGGLGQVSSMLSVDPGFATLAMRALLLTLDGMEGGKDFEDGIKQISSELIAKAQQPPPEGPPPPDYEMLKIQLQQQELAFKNQEAMSDVQLENAKLQLQAEKLQVDMARIQSEAQRDMMKQDLEERMAAFEQSIQARLAELEQYRVIQSEEEKRVEEERLAQRDYEERLIALSKPPEQEAPPININLGAL
jgi:hypothetical protein